MLGTIDGGHFATGLFGSIQFGTANLVMSVDGQIAGTWRYEKGHVRITTFGTLSRVVRKELDEEAERLAAFHV